jgi:hypothetical protein
MGTLEPVPSSNCVKMTHRWRALGLLALSLAACGGVGGTTAGPLAGPSGGPSPTDGPRGPTGGAIDFVLRQTYHVGDRVEVRLANKGHHPYRYNSTGYEACNLTYRDEAGREFIIPPGTHCDLVVIEDIAPGETVTLFRWGLDECVKDRWGCVEEELLSPGTYTIEGTFRSADGSPPATAEATFDVVPAE